MCVGMSENPPRRDTGFVASPRLVIRRPAPENEGANFLLHFPFALPGVPGILVTAAEGSLFAFNRPVPPTN